MNSPDKFMIGILVFMVSIFLARRVGENAMNKLDNNKKAQLMDLFSSTTRTIQFIFLVSSLLAYYAVIRFTSIDSQLAFVVFMIVMLGYVGFLNFRAFRKLKDNNFPSDYITAYLMSSSIRIVGMIVFFGLMIVDF